MLLLHKFRSCLTEQVILITFKKRSSQFWRISMFEHRTFELVSRFVAPWWKQCIRLPRCSWLLRWIWLQALSSRVISLSTLCTCPSLLHHFCFWFPWSCCGWRWETPFVGRWEKVAWSFSLSLKIFLANLHASPRAHRSCLSVSSWDISSNF